MAETDKTTMPDGVEQPAPEAQADNLTVPAPPDIADASGDVVIPSKVIDGLFEEKRAAAKEAEKQAAEQEAPAPEAEAPKKKGRGGRPPKGPKEEKQAGGGGISGKSAGKEDAAPVAPEPPPPPRDATRPGDAETIVYLNHANLFPFKGHPFQVRDDEAMKALVESVKERGIDQPALVRPAPRAAMNLWRDTGGNTRRNSLGTPMFPA